MVRTKILASWHILAPSELNIRVENAIRKGLYQDRTSLVTCAVKTELEGVKA